MRKMKDSGIEWISEIPQEWEICKVKNCYTWHKDIVGDKVKKFERLALTLNGVIKRSKDDNIGLQPEEFNGYQILRQDELVFKLIDLENVSTSRVGLSKFDGIVSPAYIVLHKKEKILTKFGYYYFHSLWKREIFNHIGDDGVRSNLNSNDLLLLPYALPPLPEQQAIADKLDKVCGEIDKVIAKTKAVVEEYKKLKQAIITEAVTGEKIKDEREKIKDKVEWAEIKLKWVAEFNPLSSKAVDIDDEVTFTPMECIHNGSFENLCVKNIKNNSSYVQYEEGDIVFAKVTPCFENGNIAIMKNLYSGVGFGSSELFVVRTQKANTKFMFYLLQNVDFRQQACSTMTGIGGLKRVSGDFVRNYKFNLPNEREQQEIVAYLDSKCVAIDNLITKKQQLIAEMENYKKSVIYEYVTGKKEVG